NERPDFCPTDELERASGESCRCTSVCIPRSEGMTWSVAYPMLATGHLPSELACLDRCPPGPGACPSLGELPSPLRRVPMLRPRGRRTGRPARRRPSLVRLVRPQLLDEHSQVVEQVMFEPPDLTAAVQRKIGRASWRARDGVLA